MISRAAGQELCLIFILIFICPLHMDYVSSFLTLHRSLALLLLICAVGTESIQTPLKWSVFVSLQPFAKIKKLIYVHSAPHRDRKKLKCRNVCKLIKKGKLKYHMIISIQTLLHRALQWQLFQFFKTYIIVAL